jgi:uncharacterized protein (TIGR03437 family)
MIKASILSFLFVGLLAPARAQTIATAAGSGTAGLSGDNGPATAAQIDTAYGVASDAQGNTYIADTRNHRVRRIAAANGSIATAAGKGTDGFSGDGGPAISAELSFPHAVAVDAEGNLYIADTGNSRIRKVTPGGAISTVAGSATAGFAGDGGPATSAQLSSPRGLAVDRTGSLYIADSWNFRVRKVSPDGTIRTIAGNGSSGPWGDGGAATAASLGAIEAIALDNQGNLYLADPYNHRIRKVSSSGTISTMAGADFGPAVDGGAASKANLKFPKGLVADAQGNLYFADSLNHRVRKVSTAGTIGTVAGNGVPGYSADGVAATSSQLNGPAGLAADPAGRLLIADLWNARVRSVNAGLSPVLPSSIPPLEPPVLPVITSVAHAASGDRVVAPGAYVAIYGKDLAPVTDNWNSSIVDGQLPKQVGNVSVTMGGKAAYVYYISPGQINVLAPDVSPGDVEVYVTHAIGTGAVSTPFVVQARQYNPAFFLWGKYAVATHQDGSWCAKAGSFAGYTTAAAKPGEWIVLWGTGFGPSDVPWGSLTPGDRTHSSTSLSATLGTSVMPVYGGVAALSPGFAGLYQVAVQIPASTPPGDFEVRVFVGGVRSPEGVFIAVQR